VRFGAAIVPGFPSFPLVETKIPFAASPSKQLGLVDVSVGWSVGTHVGGGGLVVVATVVVFVVVVAVVTVTVVTCGAGALLAGLLILRNRPARQSKPVRSYRRSKRALHACPILRQRCLPPITVAAEPDLQAEGGGTTARAACSDPTSTPPAATAAAATSRSLRD
jgi:hypothetical protein